MNTSRKAFNFNHNYWEQMKFLNDKQRAELLAAICEVQFLEKNISDVTFKELPLYIAWTEIKSAIENSVNGFISKQNGLGNCVTSPIKDPVLKDLDKGLGMSKKKIIINRNIDDKPKTFNFQKELILLGIDEQVAKDWISVRIARKSTNTKTAFFGISNQIKIIEAELGMTANECAKMAVENSWAVIKLDWIKNREQKFNKRSNNVYNEEKEKRTIVDLWNDLGDQN